MAICDSELYSNQTICAVMQALDALGAEATSTKDAALAALADLNTVVSDGITAMDAINYTPGTAGIDDTFNAPSAVPAVPDFAALGPTSPTFPDAPTTGTPAAVDAAPAIPSAYVVPDATDLLIESTTFDDIYTREAERLARLGVKAERDAVYRAARLGIGATSAALALGLKEAEEDTNLRTADVARDKATAEGTWLREDVKTLHGMHIENWPLRPRIALDSYSSEEGLEIEAFKAGELAKTQGYESIVRGLASAFDSEVKWALGYLNAESDRYRTFIQKFQADLQSEGERRGWSDLQMKTALEEADKATGYAISKSQYILETLRETSQATAQIIGTLAAAIYAATDYNLSGRGSQSVTENV